jgi:hypothetical protein
MVAARRGTSRETLAARRVRTKFGPALLTGFNRRSRTEAKGKGTKGTPKGEGEETVNETKRTRLVRRKLLANSSIREMVIVSGVTTADIATRGRKEERGNLLFSCLRRTHKKAKKEIAAMVVKDLKASIKKRKS